MLIIISLQLTVSVCNLSKTEKSVFLGVDPFDHFFIKISTDSYKTFPFVDILSQQIEIILKIMKSIYQDNKSAIIKQIFQV